MDELIFIIFILSVFSLFFTIGILVMLVDIGINTDLTWKYLKKKKERENERTETAETRN